MPTPFDPAVVGSDAGPPVRQSVFGNFKPELQSEPAPDARVQEISIPTETLQASIDIGMARSFAYRFLAQAFEDPTPQGWAVVTSVAMHHALIAAIRPLAESSTAIAPSSSSSRSLMASASDLASELLPGSFDGFVDDYVTLFGHAARGSCPINEIEYGDIKADPLFQPHRLADLAAFYRAFGLEITDDAAERHDHLCLEMEFMSVLTAKEAYALEHQLGADELAICRTAQKSFLREHLGRWAPAFARRVKVTARGAALAALADFTLEFVKADCHRMGVTPGSEDLLLRSIDDASEGLCASCGIHNLPPGALAAT